MKKHLKYVVVMENNMWKIINNPKTKRKEKEYSGHQLILLGYSKKKSNKKWYAIKCYDCSLDFGRYSKIKIN